MIKKIIRILSFKKYFLIFLFLTIFFVVLFVAIPVFTIIGNDLAFQISTYNNWDYFLLVILTLLSALLFTLQIYFWKEGRRVCDVRGEGGWAGAFGAGSSGILASVLGTSACAGCIAPVVVFFGLGFSTVSFFLANQIYFSILAIIIMFLAIFFILKKI